MKQYIVTISVSVFVIRGQWDCAQVAEGTFWSDRNIAHLMCGSQNSQNSTLKMGLCIPYKL